MMIEKGTSAAAPAGAEPHSAYRWYVLALLFVVYALVALDRTIPPVVTEPLRREFHLSDASLGLLAGFAYSTSFAVASLPVGYLIDRFKRRTVLAIVLGVWSLLTAGGAFAWSFTVLVVARLGVGASEAGATPASLSILADTFPLRLRSTAVGIYYTGAALGTGMSFLLGGWVLHHYGWRGVFLIAGLPGIVIALLILFTMREPVRGAFENIDHGTRLGWLETLRSIIKNGPLIATIIGVTIASGVHYSVVSWMTSFMARLHDMPVPRAATLEGFAVGIGLGVGTLVSGPIADRVARGSIARAAIVPACSCLLFFLFMLAFIYTADPHHAVIAVGLLSMAGGGFLSPGWSLMISLSEPRARGTTLSVAKLVAILIGAGGGPLVTGTLSDLIGGDQSLRPALALTSLLMLVAAGAFALAGTLARGRRGSARWAESGPAISG